MYHNEIHKFETGKDRNFKFGTRIDLGKSHLMDRKILPKGAWWILPEVGTDKARDLKFGTRIDVGMSHVTDNKIPPNEVCWEFGAKFVNFGPPFINSERVYLAASNLVCK